MKLSNHNSGEPWSDLDILDLRASLQYGDTIQGAADFLFREVEEVRDKAIELGLIPDRTIH